MVAKQKASGGSSQPNNKGSKKPTSRRQRKTNNQSRARVSPRGGVRIPALVGSLSNPWQYAPAHIPDQQTSNSGLVTSSLYLAQSFPDSTTGSSSSVHNFGFILPPYPWYTYFSGTNGVPNLTDLNPTGTLYNNPSGTYAALPSAVPNIASILGQTTTLVQRSKIRCVGMSISAVYEGTELQRSGKYFAGLIPVTGTGTIVGGTGTVISLLGAAAGINGTDSSPAFQNIRNQCDRFTEQRIGDGPFVCRWLPSSVPTYQEAESNAPEVYQTSAGVGAGTASAWFQPPGAAGSQAGQNALFFAIVGDQTAAAGANSNPYTINIRWLWEVIPDQAVSVAYPIEPSPADAKLMDSCINMMSKLTVGMVQGNGKASV